MRPDNKTASPLAYFSLIAVTAVWGASFVWVRDAVAVYPVFLFLAVRFSLATALVGSALAPRLRRFSSASLVGGTLMGLALFSGYALQTLGLKFTTAGNSGFITGLFVVFTPLFEAALYRRWPHALTALGVVFATAGLVMLSWRGAAVPFNPGDILSLGCAAVYAVHLLVTAHMSRRHDTAPLVFWQLASVALFSWMAALPDWGRAWPIPAPALSGILLTAIFATAVAYFVQTAFQAKVPPTQTALIFTLEPVFAGLFAVWIGGESLGWRGIAGGGLILLGMLSGEFGQRRLLAKGR